MPKNIVICCDGTGNEFGDNNSNVVKLYGTLVIEPGMQVGYYHPGVGTMGAPTAHNWLAKQWTRVLGLAFGAGLLPNVGDAYRYLMNVYQDGDRVFLFGFSRGSYTVRALAGVLHMFGLLYPGNEGLIPYVIRDYAKKTRDAGGMTSTFVRAGEFKETFCRPCPLHLVGVWDTVSSVGWIWDPVRLPYTAQNPDMAHGRHAISIDERRCYFQSNLWGAQLPGQDLKQVWFAGVHSDVGGSYPQMQSGLSQMALEWMVCEATPLGLLVNRAAATKALGRMPPPPPIAPNALEHKHESLKGPWWLLEVLPHRNWDFVAKKVRWRIPLGTSRPIPEFSVLHQSVTQKVKDDPTYRPKNLPVNFTVDPRNACPF